MRTTALLLLTACASAPPAPRPAIAESDDAGAPPPVLDAAAPVPFDANAAKKRIAALDISGCQALPPLADEPISLRVTFGPPGYVTAVVIGPPFTATPFAECLQRQFWHIQIPRFDGAEQSIETTVARGAVKRDPNVSRFDPATIRAAVRNANLRECAGKTTKARVTVTVKPTGAADNVTVEGDYDATARCIERVLRRVEYAPYTGVSGPVTVEIELAP
jgi:hypothetical protein